MNGAVLDASVFVALVSPSEAHHQVARALYRLLPENRPFFVPSLFRVEVMAALARRGECESVLDAVDAERCPQRAPTAPR